MRCDCDVEHSDYDKRTIGHLAAAEGHYELLEYLASNSRFNFNLRDRWNSSVHDEMKDPEARSRIQGLLIERRKNSTKENTFTVQALCTKR